MERKEKPVVPTKPHSLSVAEKARNFDRVVAEITQATIRPTRYHKSESEFDKTNIKNDVEDSNQSLNVEYKNEEDDDKLNNGVDLLTK